MNTIWYIVSALIFIGISMLTLSLFTFSRIINELELGTLKRRWIILKLLVCLFITGYIGYWVYLPHSANIESLIVSLVFVSGAIFVLAVSWLMLQTTRDVKRIASLELQNITDPLLSIFNRRYLDQRLNEEIARAQRYKLPLSLLLMDIDHFKQVNDRYGHLIGDKVLIHIGKTLKDNARKSDIVARYGGEEIVIVLPNTAEEDALVLAERTRKTLEQTPYIFDDTEIEGFRCTVSIGVASLTSDSTTLSDLLHKADAAMYQAKRTGRNRVVAYRQEYEDNQA
jgi:diguanylate cyclase (GGDEF)-like protein